MTDFLLFVHCEMNKKNRKKYSDNSGLQKVFTRLELFHILSRFTHKCKCIFIGILWDRPIKWCMIVKWKENDTWF